VIKNIVMGKKEELLRLIPEQGMLPLYFFKDTEVSLNLLKSLYKAGIRTVEYTNRGQQALDNFKALRKLVDAELPGMQLGIGTIKTTTDAENFIGAGADFIVSPVVYPPVGRIVQEAGLLWIPGCLTPTEIFTAEMSGAKLVKIFPGSLAGPSYISAIKELFPEILFMPTGGVDTTADNIKAWFNSGVVAVGMGSKLITKEIMQNKEYDKLTAATKEVMGVIDSIRKK
jgi:2-dehydro-3-deoxyphosphogluconate aldolase/(4S)-4-hydroxy-2-oxoglutarate aldolase